MRKFSEIIHIWTLGTLYKVCFVSMSSYPRVLARGVGLEFKI